MRYIFFAVLVGFFTVIPLYLLNVLVMPEINGMENFYSNIGQNANRLAGVSPDGTEIKNQTVSNQILTGY